MERSLLIIKPDAVAAGHTGEILTMVARAGLSLIALKMRLLSVREARAFYALHEGKHFFDSLVSFMTSGPVVLCVVAGPDAVRRLRTLVGVTDPARAAPGTVRAEFGTTVQRNAVHASDAPETARTEVSFFFAEADLLVEAP